jgi:hypothetical protein
MAKFSHCIDINLNPIYQRLNLTKEVKNNNAILTS